MIGALAFLAPPEQSRLKDYRELLNRGVGAVLLGAGISLRAGMADGWTLAGQLAARGGVANGDLITVCDAIEMAQGGPTLRRWLSELLDDTDIPLSDAHQLVARMGFRSYLTSNVDRLTEWALKDAGKHYIPIIRGLDIRIPHKEEMVPLFKFHGTLDHPDTMVFTSQEMATFRHKKEAVAQRLLEELTGKSLLIIGYRASDPNFVELLRWVKENTGSGEHLIIDFGREEERQPLQELGCTLIDPGSGQYDRLVDILGYLGGFDPTTLAALAQRRVIRANPFPGLSPYRYRSHAFFGREGDVERLVERLPDLPPVTVLFGESGCGKSSLINAGLIPKLEESPDFYPILTRPPADGGLEPYLLQEIAPGERFCTLSGALRKRMADGGMVVLILDQFERFFYEPFTQAEQERFLGTTLPELAGRKERSYRVLLVLRSDEVYHLHAYRDRPGMRGAFHDAEHLKTLSRDMVREVVSRIFNRVDYRLDRTCLETLLSSTSSLRGGEQIYLPYLQLLSGRFFERLDLNKGAKRSRGHTIKVGRSDFLAFYRQGDPFTDYLHDSVVALSHLEVEPVLIFRLLDRLVAGGRRQSLGRKAIEGAFGDSARIQSVLRLMADRRLVHYDEVQESYELVHDALVEPLRTYLDRQRTDFSRDEILATVSGVLERGTMTPELRHSLTTYCLRHDITPAWVDILAREPTNVLSAFYWNRLDCCLPAEVGAVWRRLARVCLQAGRLPEDLDGWGPLHTALEAERDEVAEAAASLLPIVALDEEQAQWLWGRIDPDYQGGALKNVHYPQEQRRFVVLASSLEALERSGKVDICDLFRGYGTTLVVSEGRWWEDYFRRLWRAMERGHVSPEKLRCRIRETLDMGWEDPEQMLGLFRILAQQKESSPLLNSIFQRALALLQRKRGEPWEGFHLPLSEVSHQQDWSGVRLHLLATFQLFDREEDMERACYLLGSCAQEWSELKELMLRYAQERDPAVRCRLHQAILESPANDADLSRLPNLAALGDTMPYIMERVQDLARLHDQRFIDDMIQAVEQGKKLPEKLASFSEHLRAIWPYSLCRQITMMSLPTKRRFQLYERMLRGYMADFVVALEGEGISEEEVNAFRDCLKQETLTECLTHWDDASRFALGRGYFEQGERVQGQLRWMLKLLEQEGEERLREWTRLLLFRLRAWFQEFPHITHFLLIPATVTAQSCLTETALFQAIFMLLEKKEIQEKLADLYASESHSQPNEAYTVMKDFSRIEHERILAHRCVMVEEILWWMVKTLHHGQISGGDLFLFVLLSRSHWSHVPGTSETQRLEHVINALQVAYPPGTRHYLVANLHGSAINDETKLRLLTALERDTPGSVTTALVEQIQRDWVEPGFTPQIIEALETLIAVPLADLEVAGAFDLFWTLCEQKNNEKILTPALTGLLLRKLDEQDFLLMLRLLLKKPELGRVVEDAEIILSGSRGGLPIPMKPPGIPR